MDPLLLDRVNLLLYLIAIAVVLSGAAVVGVIWCGVMLRRIHRAETPWQRLVNERLLVVGPAPVAAALPARKTALSPLPDYATARGTTPSEEPEEPAVQSAPRGTVLPRRRR